MAATRLTIKKTGFGDVRKDQIFDLYVNEQKSRTSPELAEL
jgi:hypothetical protein